MRFAEIVGQFVVKNRLLRSVADNRISHAQLFYGAEGSGALALAVAYVQYLFCDNRTETDSCGTCPSCIKLQKLVHPDLHFTVPISSNSEKKKKAEMDDYIVQWRSSLINNPYLSLNDWMMDADLDNKQGLINVEESTNIIRKLALKPYEAPYKAFIIWQPERMHVSAANKLLKSFEEPPDRTLFILVTEAYEQLLPTILSRTQLIKIPRLIETDIMKALMELHGKSENDARRIMHLSESNYNTALHLLEDESAIGDFEQTFMIWMRMCFKPSKDFDKLLKWIDKTSSDLKREGLKNFFSFALETCRQCMMINYAGDPLVRFDEDYFAGLNKFAPFINQKNANEIAEEFNKAYYHIERNAHPKILLLDLSLKIFKLLNR